MERHVPQVVRAKHPLRLQTKEPHLTSMASHSSHDHMSTYATLSVASTRVRQSFCEPMFVVCAVNEPTMAVSLPSRITQRYENVTTLTMSWIMRSQIEELGTIRSA